MAYVISKYVYQFISSDEEYLVYCSRSNSFLKVSPTLYEHLLRCNSDPLLIHEMEDTLIEKLIGQKIIVQPGEDEDYLLEHQFRTDAVTYSKKRLGLILVSTLGCNFDCFYCFENGKKAQTMTPQIIEDLISFINTHKEAESVDITWCGGEPLLAFGIIKKILHKVRNEITLKLRKHVIITNGYYFTSEAIEFFKEFPLDLIQITLDGNKERHDSIRKQKVTSEPTYDRLIQNIDNILNELPDTQVHIRINIDKTNVNDYLEAQEILGKRWKNKNVIIYPGILRMDNEQGTALACTCMNKWETAEFMYELNEKNIFKTDIFPRLSYSKNCGATRVNSHIIGPRGEIYKCWNDVSDASKIVGYINQDRLSNPSLLYRYLIGSKWYNEKKCKECFFLPICNGTCAWYVLRNSHQNADYIVCDCMQKAPDMLHRSLEYYYKSQIGKNI